MSVEILSTAAELYHKSHLERVAIDEQNTVTDASHLVGV